MMLLLLSRIHRLHPRPLIHNQQIRESTMHLVPNIASRFRLAKNRIPPVNRSFSASSNSASQETNPFKKYEYDVPQEWLPCEIENPACNVIEDDWVEVKGIKYASVIYRALYDEASIALYDGRYKALEAIANNKALNDGLHMALRVVENYLKRTAQKIRLPNQIVQLAATVSDKRTGELIAEATEKVGNDGFYSVMPVKKVDNELQFDYGMQLNWSFVSPTRIYFYEDTWHLQCNLMYPLILIHKHTIFNKSVVEQALRSTNNGQPLVIVAENVDYELIASVVRDRESLGTEVYIVASLENRENDIAILQDLAIFTGGQVVTEETDISSIPSMLGSCQEVRINPSSTTVISCSSRNENIKKRREELISAIHNSKSIPEMKFLQMRVKELSRSAAVFKVGQTGNKEEVLKKLYRVHNSVAVVHSAIETGIIPGGGVALLHASKELDKLQVENYWEKYGVQLFQHLLKMPVYSIASTAGFDGSLVIEKLLEQEDINFGYNPATGEYIDMIKSGNMDPCRLVCSELRNIVREFVWDSWYCGTYFQLVEEVQHM